MIANKNEVKKVYFREQVFNFWWNKFFFKNIVVFFGFKWIARTYFFEDNACIKIIRCYYNYVIGTH